MKLEEQIMKLTKVIVIFIVVLAGGWFVGNVVDAHFDDQDQMLCNSALKSGNREYLTKCECFYAGQDVRCIYLD